MLKYIPAHDSTDCGVACLRMIAGFHGRDYSPNLLRKCSYLTRQGANLANLGSAAEQIGFKALIGESSLKYLCEKGSLPCILFWNENHFVVLYKIRRLTRGKKKGQCIFYIADPGVGKIRIDQETFTKYWLRKPKKGFALFLEPTLRFYERSEPEEQAGGKDVRNALRFLSVYFRRYKGNYLKVAFAMVFTSFILILIPFLTQGIIDVGVSRSDIHIVFLLVLFQIILFASTSFAEIVRSHLLMHIGGRINLSILSDFLNKLLKLPLSFFASKMSGDIMQRISDNRRIDDFITTSLLSTFFSILTLLVFSGMLWNYNFPMFLIFVIGSVMSILWAVFFTKARKSIDYSRFREMSNASDKLYELVNGIHEIKLNNFANYKKWDWQDLQVKLFKTNIRTLKLDQYQKIGSAFINQVKNASITCIAAYTVINGQMTLGMMLAVSYIIGQLNLPISQFVELLNSYQLAKIAIERMNEVYIEQNEEDRYNPEMLFPESDDRFRGIELKNVSYQYEGKFSEMVLKNVNLRIPEGKITAIVGTSGSGKTTLLKLLLKFFLPVEGEILLNGRAFEMISPENWRSRCGAVMQEGFIFSDSIARNIAMGDESGDTERLINAAEVANIDEFIAELPGNVDTRIGQSGTGLSTGQKQRILIARAVYKDPEYLFFDEATSSLDAKNERVIMNNLSNICKGKTVVIVAHRLSTVKNADQIIVIENGVVVETGTHYELVNFGKHYYNLVKNQLELGV
jgi:ATP-binding cassette, subfamily B, bacterial